MPVSAICYTALLALAGSLAAQSGGAPPAGDSVEAEETLGAEEATALAREIAPKVEKLRGLSFKSRVPVRVVDEAQVRAHFERRAARYWPEARVRAEQTAYTQIGLIPAGIDLYAILFEVVEEQVGGYYDPESDTFFVLGHMPRASAPIIVAHELTHALDDQHFGIDSMLDKALADEDEDRSAALGFVIEGSGTLVMSAFMVAELQAGRMSQEALLKIQQSEAGRAEKLRAAPEYLRRGLLGSYLLGQTFMLRGNMMALALGIAPEDINRAFTSPPDSSEQVIHPDKYWKETDRDLPRPVALPDLSETLGEGWSLAERGRLGELNLAVLTGAAPIDPDSPGLINPEAWTNQAAAGWGGDVWHLYRNGDRHVTVLATLWDTEPDAFEFEAALAALPGRRAARRADAVVVTGGDAPARLAETALSHLAPVQPAGK